METKILQFNENEACDLLLKGEVLAFPTETVYGLGALASRKESLDKLVSIKNRPADKPFTLMCSNITQIVQYAEVDSKAINIMKSLMPGELTLLLKARKGVPSWVDLGSGVIGVRIPDSQEVIDLIDKVGEPLLVSSANISGHDVCKNFDEVTECFNGKIAGIVKGETKSNLPSTIVDLTGNNPKLIRQGSLSLEEIQKASQRGINISLGSDHGGFKYKEEIKAHLETIGVQVIDCGCYNESSCDYPDFAFLAASKVINHEADLGILVCTSGEGISIAANKIKGIRCGLGYDDIATGKTREHNDANMIAFGQKYMSIEDVLRRVDIFISENSSPLRKHKNRVKKIIEIEK